MIYYFFLPIILLFLVVLQNRISDILFCGIIGVEVSLILVIYAGFRLDIIRGGILSFFLGFFLDCIAGTALGLYAFIYVFIFLISMVASLNISLNKVSMIMIITLMCTVLKGIIITILHPSIYGIDISIQLLKVNIPQTLLVILISPVFFQIFYRIESLLSGGNAKQPERT